MAGVTSYDDIINQITTNGQKKTWNFFKIGRLMEAAGTWASLWMQTGTPGAGSAASSTPGAALDSANGGITFEDTSPDTKHLLSIGAVSTQQCVLMIYDRLVEVGSVSLVGTGNKTVNSAALTRYTDGLGVQAWLEVTTPTTGTAAVVSMNSYTNEAGTTGQTGTTIAMPAAATELSSLLGPLPFASGDQGVRAISTLNVATAASAGVVSVLLIKPLVFLPLIPNQWNEKDLVLQLTSLERIYDSASLGIAVLATATTAMNIWGSISLVYN